MSHPHYPDPLPVAPLAAPPVAAVTPPGSKSITNRALVLAALSSAGGPQTLTGCLDSEDVDVMIDGLRKLGYGLDREGDAVTVRRDSPRVVPAERADLYVANSGTTMRFLTALAALGQGTYRLDGVPRMRQRPLADLLDALAALGVRAESEAGDGCPPVVVRGGTWRGGRVAVKGDVSSQFLSGLLMAAPFAGADTAFDLAGDLVSRPYVEMTRRMMQHWRLRIAATETGFAVPGGQTTEGPPGGTYHVEPDASAASYFFAAAAITGGEVTVPGLTAHSIQGDVRFVDVLERMGCRVTRAADGITVRGGPLRGIDVGMSDVSDTVMTLAAVACFAEGPTTIRNVAHVRHKETDRLAALTAELRKFGVGVVEYDDGLTVTPAPLRGAEVRTYDDHRMAMSLALVGLRVPGVLIQDPGCVGKTYPNYFLDLDRLR